MAVFDLAAEHRDILDTEEFFELASQSLYGVWFRTIVVPGLGLAGVPEQEQRTLFRQAVSRAAHLFASFEANGFDTQHPITVARIPAGTEVAGRSLAEDRWVPVDGCHRLALLVRSGHSHIEIDQYVIDPDGDRRHNTATMRDALGQTESEAVALPGPRPVPPRQHASRRGPSSSTRSSCPPTGRTWSGGRRPSSTYSRRGLSPPMTAAARADP